MKEEYIEQEFGVIRKSDGAFIPRDEGNMDYVEYLRYKSELDSSPKD